MTLSNSKNSNSSRFRGRSSLSNLRPVRMNDNSPSRPSVVPFANTSSQAETEVIKLNIDEYSGWKKFPRSLSLIDPKYQQARAPYTFHLPYQVELDAIGRGDKVKLIFNLNSKDKKGWIERMWVQVVGVDGDDLVGVLANIPTFPKAAIGLGDQVSFSRNIAIAIEWAKPEAAPTSPERNLYLERCLVEELNPDGSFYLGYIYRETPDVAKDREGYPDSGWRVRASKDSDTRPLANVQIARVLNADDSWVHLIDAPVGSEFIRDIETGAWSQVQ